MCKNVYKIRIIYVKIRILECREDDLDESIYGFLIIIQLCFYRCLTFFLMFLRRPGLFNDSCSYLTYLEQQLTTKLQLCDKCFCLEIENASFTCKAPLELNILNCRFY